MSDAVTLPLREPVDVALSPVQRDAVARALAVHAQREGALLPILHAVQDVLGFVPAAAVPVIANRLNLSRAEVHGVLTFYHHFRTTPPGRHILRLCRAEACQAMGGVALERTLLDRLGIGYHETTADGAVTLEPVYCLGNCATAPSLQLDGELHGRVTTDRLADLLAALESAS